MSHNEWEEGTIKLPTAEFARLRKAMQDNKAKHCDTVFDLTQECWKSLSRKETTDPDAYKAAVRKYLKENEARTVRMRNNWGDPVPATDADLARKEAIRDAGWRMDLRWGQTKPARVQKSQIDFPTNRTLSFGDGGGSITFNREDSTVTWDCDGNRARERARETTTAKEFFQLLDTVKWTRGTGGVFTGNDESARESRYEGGGANYVTTAYGPIGAAESPNNCEPYTDSQGNRVTRDHLHEMWQEKFKKEMKFQAKMAKAAAKAASSAGTQGRDRIGRFAEMGRSEPTIRLW